MTHTFKLARWAARFRAVALVAAVVGFMACENADRLGPITLGDTPTVANPTSSSDSAIGLPVDPAEGDTLTDAQVEANEALGEAAFVTGRTAQGVAFGAFDLPSGKFSPSITGSVRAVGPDNILQILAAARKSGARVVVRLSRSSTYWTNRNPSVNLALCKWHIARFKRVNLKPYIADGTLLAHYMIDEPHDASNWGGKPVPFATLEAMAKFSKQLWPGLTTVVRSYPDWLAKAPFRWRYLDAAWAQYSARKGEVNSWMRTQASYARQEGLGLIVGLNWLHGGRARGGRYPMSASQIKSFGSALASNSYACGVYNWRYDTRYFGRSDIKAAIAYVASKSKNRTRQSCRQ